MSKITKEETKKLFDELKEEYNLNDWKLKFSRAYTTFGQCDYNSKRIIVSEKAIEQTTYKDVKQTLIHEFAHAIVGPSHNHNEVWRKQCIAMGGKGERCASVSLDKPYKYIVGCYDGCWKKRYMNRPKYNVARRICGKCKGKLFLRKLDKDGNYEL